MVKGKSNPTCAFIWVVLIGFVLHNAKAALQTKFIEDLCHYQESVRIDLRFQPTGILISIPQTQLSQVFECEVILNPPKESSVVLSIYRYDVESNDSLTIEDSDRFKIALMGYGNFKDERKSFISEGKMVIKYRRKVLATAFQRQGFQFTFTSVKKDGACYDNEFRCNNRLCILKEYVCDGHNHCGDGSDQKKCAPKDERVSNTNLDDYAYRRENSKTQVVWISIIAVSGAIVFIIVVVFIVVVVRMRKAKAPAVPSQNLPRNSNSQTSGGNVPLQSVSSTVPQQQPHAPTTGTVPSAPPAPDHEGFSFYNRVRRSIRGIKNPKPEDASKEIVNSTEVYQVPSMYPNLDQHESSSAEGGVINPEFKIDE